MADNSLITVNDKLDNIEGQFVGQPFLRCHKSYIVNLKFVKEIDKTLMIFKIDKEMNVHISRENFSLAKKTFENYLFDKTREGI